MTPVLAQQGRGRLETARNAQGGVSGGGVGIHVFILKILVIRTWFNQMS